MFTKSTTTKHDCGGPVFGRYTEGCPRCEELAAGARPVKGWGQHQKEMDARRSLAIADHFRKGGPHDLGHCGPVCAAFDY